MPNSWFKFKQFIIHQDHAAMKVTTDACLFGAWIASRMTNQLEKIHVLDIGTGTGLLSLMFAQAVPAASIDAIEIDKKAASQAKENVYNSPWSDRISVEQADIRSWPITKKYDCIICNPPFYEDELKSSSIAKNIAHHSESLDLGETLSQIERRLEPGGLFFLLLPYKRKAAATMLLEKTKLNLLENCEVKQSVNHHFFRMMWMGTAATNSIIATRNTELAITGEHDEYTPGFVELLKSYYLKL